MCLVVMCLLKELSKLSICDAQWTDYKWDANYPEVQSELLIFVLGPMPGHLAWVCSDLLGYNSTAFALCWKILVIHAHLGLAPTSICECGMLDQTAAHVISNYS